MIGDAGRAHASDATQFDVAAFGALWGSVRPGGRLAGAVGHG